MKSNTKLISTIAALIAGLAGMIPVLGIYFADDDTAWVQSSINVTVWVMLAGIALAVFSALRGIVVNPAGMRGALIGVVALLVVLGVSYGLADGSDYAMFNTDEETAKSVSIGMNAFYIIGVMTLVSVLYSAVARIIK